MHRTQIMLEDRQYDALKSWARRSERSLSEVVRVALDRLLGLEKRRSGRGRLASLRGAISDPGGPRGDQHDEVLYGWKK